ncbi:MAG: hypothetical protein QXU81_09695 [Candidatus Bathyarchaeia archaeon]
MKYLVISTMLIIIGASLCVINFIAPYVIVIYEAVQVPYQVTENRTSLLEHAEDYSIGEYSYSGYNLEAGKSIIISWQADYSVIVYLMTESQYNVFLATRYAGNLKSDIGMSGSFSYPISFNGKYYVVIYNPNWILIRVRIVFYEAKLSWQETVTRYRIENVPREVRTNAYLYSGLIVMAIGIVMLPIIKKRQPFNPRS